LVISREETQIYEYVTRRLDNTFFFRYSSKFDTPDSLNGEKA